MSPIPYVKQERRGCYVELKQVPENPGELNYLISSLLIAYVREHGLSYLTINDALGALSGAQMEFYRRVAVPVEDVKMRANGDLPYPAVTDA